MCKPGEPCDGVQLGDARDYLDDHGSYLKRSAEALGLPLSEVEEFDRKVVASIDVAFAKVDASSLSEREKFLLKLIVSKDALNVSRQAAKMPSDVAAVYWDTLVAQLQSMSVVYAEAIRRDAEEAAKKKQAEVASGGTAV